MEETKKIVVGLTGLMACGKDTVKKYLNEKYGAENCRFSTSMRDILDRIYLDKSRENLSKLATVLRAAFGEDTFSKAIVKDAEKLNSEIVVVDGARRKADVFHLRQLPNFFLIGIEAKPEIRHARLMARGENAGDAEKTFEQFMEDHKLETEVEIPDLVASANFTLNNDGSFEDLYKQIDEIMIKIKG